MSLKYSDIPKFDYSKKIALADEAIRAIIDSQKGRVCGDIRPVLRKTARINSIQSTIAIEGNSLGFLKVKDLIDCKSVEGPFDEITEAKNAIEAYRLIGKTDIMSVDCFLKIESIMMWGLVEENGFRDGKVVIAEGEKIIYEPPEAGEVASMIDRLFDWCSSSGYPLHITSAVMHYYIEAIHPFRDGNGRMGRFWHSAMLRKESKLFRLVSIENAIRNRQQDYYQVLERCQTASDCTEFIEFMLDIVLSSLMTLTHIMEPKMAAILMAIGSKTMSSSEIMSKLGLKDRGHFQKEYLRPALDYGFIEMTDPESPRSPTQKYRGIIL